MGKNASLRPFCIDFTLLIWKVFPVLLHSLCLSLIHGQVFGRLHGGAGSKSRKIFQSRTLPSRNSLQRHTNQHKQYSGSGREFLLSKQHSGLFGNCSRPLRDESKRGGFLGEIVSAKPPSITPWEKCWTGRGTLDCCGFLCTSWHTYQLFVSAVTAKPAGQSLHRTNCQTVHANSTIPFTAASSYMLQRISD